MNSTFIVVIVLLAFLTAGGGYLVYRVRKAARMFSNAAFGTNSLAEGLKRQADLLSATPKSVASMTKLCLPQIGRDFPDFNWAQFRVRAEQQLNGFLTAVDSQDLSVLKDASTELEEQVNLRILDCRSRQVRECFRQIRIHQTEISRYRKEKGLCIIEIQSAAEYFHYTEDLNGSLLKGERDRLEQVKYHMELIYIQNLHLAGYDKAAVALTCPQCGAPVSSLGSKYCQYCRAAISEIHDHVWSLNKMKEIYN